MFRILAILFWTFFMVATAIVLSLEPDVSKFPRILGYGLTGMGWLLGTVLLVALPNE